MNTFSFFSKIYKNYSKMTTQQFLCWLVKIRNRLTVICVTVISSQLQSNLHHCKLRERDFSLQPTILIILAHCSLLYIIRQCTTNANQLRHSSNRLDFTKQFTYYCIMHGTVTIFIWHNNKSLKITVLQTTNTMLSK